jgi:hypothetical protein
LRGLALTALRIARASAVSYRLSVVLWRIRSPFLHVQHRSLVMMKTQQFTLVVLCASLILVFGALQLPDVRADSVLGNYSPNGVLLTSTESNSFNGVGSTPGADSNIAGNYTRLIPSSEVADYVNAGTTLLPAGGGLAKDQASGHLTVTCTLGSPWTTYTNDQMEFMFNGTLSAVAAKNSAGNPASAQLWAFGNENFSIDAPPPTGSTAGYLNLPSLRNLAATETSLEVVVNQDSAPILFMQAGDPAQVVNLDFGHQYDVRLNYSAQAPYGTDPTYNLDYRAQISSQPLPEPGALTLLSVATATIGLFGWRRRR